MGNYRSPARAAGGVSLERGGSAASGSRVRACPDVGLPQPGAGPPGAGRAAQLLRQPGARAALRRDRLLRRSERCYLFPPGKPQGPARAFGLRHGVLRLRVPKRPRTAGRTQRAVGARPHRRSGNGPGYLGACGPQRRSHLGEPSLGRHGGAGGPGEGLQPPGHRIHRHHRLRRTGGSAYPLGRLRRSVFKQRPLSNGNPLRACREKR